MDYLHSEILRRADQAGADVKDLEEMALMSGAMPSEFSVRLKIRKVGCCYQMVAILA